MIDTLMNKPISLLPNKPQSLPRVAGMPVIVFDALPDDMMVMASPGCLKVRSIKKMRNGRIRYRMEFDKRKIVFYKNGREADPPKEAVYFYPECTWSFKPGAWDRI